MKLITNPDSDSSARGNCRNTEAKGAIATSLGKEPSEIDDTQLTEFLRDGGTEEVLSEMTACVESAADATARGQCKTVTAKAALVKSLGKESSEVSDTELTRFVADGAKKQ